MLSSWGSSENRIQVQLADRLSHCIQEYEVKIEALASQIYGHTKLFAR